LRISLEEQEPAVVFRVICGKCGKVLYSGFTVRNVEKVLRVYGFKCKYCNAPLAPENFTIQVRTQA